MIVHRPSERSERSSFVHRSSEGEPDRRGDDKELSRAKNAAYRLLTYRPRSRRELEGKLREREFPEDIVESVIEQCMRLGYLDDARFAEQWARSRVRLRGFGRRRIEQELRSKGIDRESVRDALDRLFEDSSEAEVARKEADKKLKTLSRFDPEVRRRRLAGFLERKGFSSGIIRSILHTVR
jgi:regulatory protein